MATTRAKLPKPPAELITGSRFKVLERNRKIGCKPQEVLMRVDESGLVLYWDFLKSKQRRFVFMDCITDVRIGKQSSSEMTLVCNKDYISPAFLIFEADPEIIKEWSNQLFKLAYALKRHYRSVLSDIQRLFAPLQLDDNSKYKAENAYEHLNMPYENAVGKFTVGSSIKSVTTIDNCIDVYLEKVPRPELEALFNKISKGKPTLSIEEFIEFLNQTQRDARLNEEIFPFLTPKLALKIVDEIEPGQTELSYRGFLKFLLGDLSTDLDTTMQRTKIADMILLAGCRCIELDCWDGPTGPVITHGPISLQKINTITLREACEAIMETAFKSSEYPVVLSLENHCSPPQQEQMAETFISVFGDHLLGKALDSHPLRDDVMPPAPASLRNKILLKGSKSKGVISAQKLRFSLRRSVEGFFDKLDKATGSGLSNSEEYSNKRETTADEEIDNNIPRDFYMKDVAVASVETKAALADLINYFQTSPVLNYEDPPFIMHSGTEKKIDNIITKKSTEFIRHTARHIVRVYPDIRRIDSSNFIPMYFWTAGCQLIALNFQTAGLPMQMNETMFEENSRCGYVLKHMGLRQTSYKLSVHDSQMYVAHRLEIEIISAQLLNLLVPNKETFKTSIFVDLYDLPNDTVIDKFQATEERQCGFNTIYTENKFVFPKIIKPEHSMLHIRVLDELGQEIGQRFLPVHKMQAGYRHVILRNRANRSEGPVSVFCKIKTEIYVPPHQQELRQQFATPLKALKEQNEMREALANPMRLQKRRETIDASGSGD